ncbi:hypothetical protein BASA81_007546 [Batrachochytrium salamandrivorans]|nr:hypothetical protein BASA81_007546 [Batrachochytrium salamandrivorans]
MEAARLEKLQSRVVALRDLVNMGIPPKLDQILACEALIEGLDGERTLLMSKLGGESATPAGRKLAKDFAKFAPIMLDIIAKANQACLEARMRLQQLDEPEGKEEGEELYRVATTVEQVQPRMVHDEESTKLVKSIEQRAHTVRALHENVALLVSTQGEDMNQVSQYSHQSRDDVVYGLGELAELKKREAGKHTVRGLTTSAVIGGSMGLIGGPFGVAIGLAAGAAVGSLLGGTVANISRRNIDREVRAFKEKFKLGENADGLMVCQATVFENESWSWSTRTWSSSLPSSSGGGEGMFKWRDKWTADELGKPVHALDPSPMNPNALPKVPVIRLAATPNLDLEEEDLPPGVWRWESNSMWTPDIGDDQADTGGWKYAYSFDEGAVWYAQPTRTCLVRRRCWVRNQVLIPMRRYHEKSSAPLSRMVPSKSDDGGDALLGSAIEQMGQSLQTSQDTLSEIHFQAQQFEDSARDMAIIEDATLFASRVSRAVTLGGVIRNALSARPNTQSDLVHVVHVPKQYHPPPLANGGEGITQIDHLERLCQAQLAVSNEMHLVVEAQNEHLDVMLDSSYRTTQQVEWARDMI